MNRVYWTRLTNIELIEAQSQRDVIQDDYNKVNRELATIQDKLKALEKMVGRYLHCWESGKVHW